MSPTVKELDDPSSSTSRGNIGDSRDFNPSSNGETLHGRPHDGVLDLPDGLDFLRFRVSEADAAVELTVDVDIDVFVDRRA